MCGFKSHLLHFHIDGIKFFDDKNWVELATSLREAVDVPTPIVAIEIFEPDGLLLMREEYPAN